MPQLLFRGDIAIEGVMQTPLLTNVGGPTTQEPINVNNVIIITKIEKTPEKIFTMVLDGERKIAEEEVLWCTNDKEGELKTALVDKILPLQKTIPELPGKEAHALDEPEQNRGDVKLILYGNDENSLPVSSSSGLDEPLQFELDNRNSFQPSSVILSSPGCHQDDLTSTQSAANVRLKEKDSELNGGEIIKETTVYGETRDYLREKVEADDSNEEHHDSSVNVKSQLYTNTPPLKIFSPNEVDVSSERNSSSKGTQHPVSPPKRNRRGQVVRPFVYSAIGSLEFVNQNSLGSFNQKLCQACKSKTKLAARLKSEARKPRKANEGGSDMVHTDESKLLQPETFSKNKISTYGTQSCGTEVTVLSDTNDKAPSSTDGTQAERKNETRALQLEDEITRSNDPRMLKDADDKSIQNIRRGNRGKKRGTVRPVELFRPSCDAYTPRMGQKEIKYKPAKERAFMEEISTTMGTIQRPNFRDALRRVAIIIQQHIVKIEQRFAVGVAGLDNAGLFTPAMRVAFAEDNFVTPRYKCNMVNIPMARPGVIYGMRKIRTKYKIPTANDIYDFAYKIFHSVQLSSECSIICLIYVERLMEVAKVPVMANTWRPIFMCGLLLASKVWQDWSSWNVEFASVYPQFTLSSINRLEVQFLKMIKWNLHIWPSLYAKYYFALRSLLEKQDFRHRYNRMVGADSRAAYEAYKVSKRSEIVKRDALLNLSISM